ncbi:MAG: DUF4197 domain-containing protein [Salinivirgaceae bacterium]|nr:DUF4197 domain-containing protein [Salinivirgaceae bacterium]
MKLKSVLRRGALATLGLGMSIAMTSCEELFNSETGTFDTSAALKEALNIGAQTAAIKLGEDGGYLNDAAVKIGVPDEVSTVVELAGTEAGQTILTLIGAEVFNEGELIQLMNKAAEKAAPQSAAIFADAILGMTIQDADNILFGAQNAATEYLRATTYSGLTVVFGEVVTGVFDQVSVGGKTLNDAWAGFTQYYNKVIDFKERQDLKALAAMLALKAVNAELYHKVAAMDRVNTNLGEYVTGKALDGLFVKVEEKEKGIRTDVSQRTSDLLRKVFGQLDEQ